MVEFAKPQNLSRDCLARSTDPKPIVRDCLARSTDPKSISFHAFETKPLTPPEGMHGEKFILPETKRSESISACIDALKRIANGDKLLDVAQTLIEKFKDLDSYKVLPHGIEYVGPRSTPLPYHMPNPEKRPSILPEHHMKLLPDRIEQRPSILPEQYNQLLPDRRPKTDVEPTALNLFADVLTAGLAYLKTPNKETQNKLINALEKAVGGLTTDRPTGVKAEEFRPWLC